ncbi:LicD family protein [Ruminococcaceae bacterium YRB3002]|nr:LicD family protein [Ruminococcaceae bacterium YRB3002]
MNENDFRIEMHEYIDRQYDLLNACKKDILNIFKVFHKICVDNNIRYSVVFGSLLGIVRDNGFIPWDSDFDVGVPIVDVQKLISALKEQLPSEYFFESNYTNSDYPYFQIRIGKKGLDLETTHLDVFYLFGVDDNEDHIRKIQDEYLSLFDKRIMKFLYYTNLKKMPGKSKGQKVKMFYYGLKSFFVSAGSLDRAFNKVVSKYDYETAAKVCIFCHLRHVYDKSSIEPVRKITVNGTDVLVPNDELAILKASYRDYTEYLPIHARFDEFYNWVTYSQKYNMHIDYRNEGGETK